MPFLGPAIGGRMTFLRTGIAVLGAVSLGGCVTTGRLPVQAIDRPAIEKAQAEIKRQIGIYFSRAHSARMQAAGQDATRPARWCGDGSIEYDVASVKVDLLTTEERSNSVEGGVKIPVVSGSADPSASGKRGVSNTQQLTYTLYMLDDRYQPPELTAPSPVPDQRDAPLADMIMAQREALLNTTLRSIHADPQPCFTNFDPDSPRDPKTTLVIGVTFSKAAGGGIKVDLGLVSFGFAQERKANFGNTVTVTFRQRNLTKDSRIGPCPKDASKPCVYDPIETIDGSQDGIGLDGGTPPVRETPTRGTRGGRENPRPVAGARPVPGRLQPEPAKPRTVKMCRTPGSTGVLVNIPCPPEVLK